jgi:hypothetical protein
MKWLVQYGSGTLSYLRWWVLLLFEFLSLASTQFERSNNSTVDNSKYAIAITVTLLDLKIEFKWSTALPGGWAEPRRN